MNSRRPKWLRNARKALAAHIPAIRAAMADGIEPPEPGYLVHRYTDEEEEQRLAVETAKQILRVAAALDAAANAAANALADHFNEITNRKWGGRDLIEADGYWRGLEDAVNERWREAMEAV